VTQRVSASATARNVLGPLLRLGYRVEVTGGHRVPARGPLLAVAPHEGFLDASLLATALPRPVDVLVDAGPWAARVPGRIVVDPADPGSALRSAVARLIAGGAVGAWAGDGMERAAGYLATRSGCPVLPVAVLGGGGQHPTDPPPWRSRIHVVVGDPFVPDVPVDPHARRGIVQVAEQIRQHVADHVVVARTRTGRGVGLGPVGAGPDNGAL
jgi:1-acyl-sn-glycerol-3-phosphate acyltransferase